MSASFLCKRLSVTYETAWQLLHRLRSAVRCQPPAIRGTPLASVIGFGCGRPYRDGAPPDFLGRKATVAAIVDETGVAIKHLRHRCRIDPWMENIVDGEVPVPSRTGQAMAVLLALWRQVVFTHAGLSELWLHRYISEVQFRLNGGEARDFIDAAVSSGNFKFSQVRPPFEPWGFSRAWLPWKATPLWRVGRNQAFAATGDVVHR